MSNTEPLELAERCEKATGPDPQIDTDILFEVVWEGQGHEPQQTPFTASIDAAMTLVPEGWHLTHSGEGRFLTNGRFVATLETWAIETDEEGEEVHTTPARYHAVAETFPLALCAAALKARASQ